MVQANTCVQTRQQSDFPPTFPGLQMLWVKATLHPHCTKKTPCAGPSQRSQQRLQKEASAAVPDPVLEAATQGPISSSSPGATPHRLVGLQQHPAAGLGPSAQEHGEEEQRWGGGGAMRRGTEGVF